MDGQGQGRGKSTKGRGRRTDTEDQAKAGDGRMDTGGQGQRMTGEEAGTADGQGGTELKAKGEAWGLAKCEGADSNPCGNWSATLSLSTDTHSRMPVKTERQMCDDIIDANCEGAA